MDNTSNTLEKPGSKKSLRSSYKYNKEKDTVSNQQKIE